jgi:hypothetical protein
MMIATLYCRSTGRSETNESAAGAQNDDSAHQSELVKWTKILAIVTGALAFATFLVAAFSGWQVNEARRAADQQHTDTGTSNAISREAFEAVQHAYMIVPALARVDTVIDNKMVE